MHSERNHIHSKKIFKRKYAFAERPFCTEILEQLEDFPCFYEKVNDQMHCVTWHMSAIIDVIRSKKSHFITLKGVSSFSAAVLNRF